jgi:hypothetical protein
MAAFTGTSGDITFTYNEADLLASLHPRKWDLNITMDAVDTTPFGATSNARTKLPGLCTCTGTADGFCDNAAILDQTLFTAAMVSGAATIVLKESASRTFTIVGRIQSYSIGPVTKDGAVTWSLAFVGVPSGSALVTPA